MSKRKNYQLDRRRLRRMEKLRTEEAATSDKMIGRACRRGWGAGAAIDRNDTGVTNDV